MKAFQEIDMKAICPNDALHNQFITTAHVVEDWVVDAHGNFIESLGAVETAHKPDQGNTWTCKVCGAEAKVVG